MSKCKRGGTPWIKHGKILTAKQAEFVNKELSASNNTISIKKIVTSNKSEETELDKAYPKALIAGIENMVKHGDQKKSPAQMKEWSILSDHVKYVYAEVVSSDRFDEDTDLSTTYLGQIDMTRNTEVKAEENFPITAQGYTKGKLLDGTECDILEDTGASKSYMSKSYFMRCKSLHSLPQFTSMTTRIQVGKVQYVGVLFIIPVIMTIQNHRFEIFTLVSEIHEKVDLIIGIKNLFELEGVIDSQDSCVNFLNRSIPFFPKEKVSVKPK